MDSFASIILFQIIFFGLVITAKVGLINLLSTVNALGLLGILLKELDTQIYHEEKLSFYFLTTRKHS